MGRSPCCDESGLKKGPWTPEEDEKLLHYIQKNGHGSWRTLPRLAGTVLQSPAPNFFRLWSAIATHLPGRTDNEIKNFWNTHLKKRLIQMGFDPMTHRPRTDFFAALPQLIALATLRDQLAATACGGGGGGDTAAAAAAQIMQGAGGGGGADVAIQAAKMQYLQCLLQPRRAPCAFSEAPVITSDDVEANLRLLGCGAGGADAFTCHGGSLPPLADLSDVTTTTMTNPLDWCSATASASSCGGGGGASSPFPWPEFFHDDPFITDFL
ncbi:hypothetical protein OsI_29670 [Oryza sativa Indica Group]|uniref:Uncharacterized protein n=1 Tax=Oryza sativa subsp. indica TaxID=39946 RepID=B8BBV7_ORYSI|nr:hypothetical protein OsI_29670 [Oryza sativa Indica Group]